MVRGHELEHNTGKKHRIRPSKLNNAAVITILIAFHLKGYRNLKHCYINYVQEHLQKYFPQTVSCNRFVELQQKAGMPLVLFLKTLRPGKTTGISFVDSTPRRVCHNKRIHNHKVFQGNAQRGKSTIGCLLGFMYHLKVNEQGAITDSVIALRNTDDRQHLKDGNLLKKISWKLFGMKGYISKDIVEKLFVDGIHLITGIRNNIKNQLMTIDNRIMLRKRSIIETIDDGLRNICKIEHSRHRSFVNFIANLISGLLAYSFLPKRPGIKYETRETYGQLALF